MEVAAALTEFEIIRLLLRKRSGAFLERCAMFWNVLDGSSAFGNTSQHGEDLERRPDAHIQLSFSLLGFCQISTPPQQRFRTTGI